MKKYYKIAGLTIEMDSFGKTVDQAEEYLIPPQDAADIVIRSNWKLLKEKAPHLSDEDCEYLSSGSNFYLQLINFDGFLIHSSAVVMDGKAYLFTAPCGTGKSTHTSIWLKEFGDRAFILNDDKPAVRFENGEFIVYGPPWSGKTDKNVNTSAPLAGVCLLNRGEKNEIKRISGTKAVFGILSQTVRPKTKEYVEKLLELLSKLINDVPIWELHCNMDNEAARVSYTAMSSVLENKN